MVLCFLHSKPLTGKKENDMQKLWVKLGDENDGVVLGPYHSVDTLNGKHVIMENYEDNTIHGLRYNFGGNVMYNQTEYKNIRVLAELPKVFAKRIVAFDVTKT